MAHSKPLLIPWLRAQIDSGRYPGVQWTNPERTEFSVPWKHALRQDSSDTDVLIFKAWAEVSGNGRAQGEASIWKRNFRSALRAKGFKMLDDNRNDAANPHKVFRFPEEAAANHSAPSQDQEDPTPFEDYGVPVQESGGELCIDGSQYIVEDDMFTLPPFTDSTATEDILQQCLEGLNISLEPDGTAGFQAPPEQQQLPNHGMIGGHPLPGQQQYPVTFEGAGGEAGLPQQPAHGMEGAEGGVGNELQARFLHTVNKTVDGGVFNTQFKVKVYYRGEKVCEQLVTNEAGVRLVYRPDIGPVVDPDSGLTLVSLPSPNAMPDRTQARLTQCILDRLDSLDVGVSGPVVYGQRLGEMKAFWSFSKFDQSREPQEVPKHPQPLYLIKDFTQGIINFIEGGECPPCSLFFCIGEKWPDPENRSWEKKLITVEVVLTSVELLKTIAVQGGSSSLRSVELQISLEKMMDMY